MYRLEIGLKEFDEAISVLLFEDEELWSLFNYIRSNPDLELISVHKDDSIVGIKQMKEVIQEIKTHYRDHHSEDNS